MLVNPQVGSLTEALGGRHWDRPAIADQLLRRIACYRDAGLRQGDRVFIYFGNNLELFVDLLALWHLGACAVPIDTRLTPFEVENLVRSAGPCLLLHLGNLTADLETALASSGVTLLDSSEAGRVRPAAPPPSALALDQDALILFTSGSTGDPKGVVHTHRSLRARWISLQQCVGLRRYRRTLCLLPTHFGHGLIVNSLFPWLGGQDLVIAPAGDIEVSMRLGSLLDEHAITFMSSVPPIWKVAVKVSRPPQAGTLERVSCGSAPLSAQLWRQIQEWCGISEVWNVYGITETASWVAGTSAGDPRPEDGLIGVPWGAVIRVMKSGTAEQPPGLGEECRPGESGHLWINTPALMKGYLGREDLTRQVVNHGWFSTGDIGAVDERGWLYLRGREREEINRGGTKIYPADIEAVAERFDKVSDVCCFAVDDKLYGQAVGIAVVLARPGDGALRALHAWLERHLASFQLPTRWYVLDAIPRTVRGKVNRAAVAAACSKLEPVDLSRAGDGA